MALPTPRTIRRSPLLALLALLLLAGLLPHGVSAAPIGAWAPTGALPIGHIGQATANLNNGKVLAAGGMAIFGNSTVTSSLAMLYDPASGTWNSTGGLATERTDFTLTRLANGRVLAAGGSTENGTTKSAELYDPATGLWNPAGTMTTNRRRHTATLLANGKVLVAGGEGYDPVQTAELYDPATNSWAQTGSLVTARAGQTAVRLGSGKVLVVGGQRDDDLLASAELYDPATATWSITGSLTVPRLYHAMAPLANGMVLVSGGLNLFTFQSTAAVERFDPATGAWTTLPSMQSPRAIHTMTTLPSGDVLVTGGYFSGVALASAEIYNPAGNSWYLTGGLDQTRLFHRVALLNSGKVIAFGGYLAETPDQFEASTATELYDPALAVETFAVPVAATGPGTATAIPAGGAYPRGTTVVLQATPAAAALFLGWTLDGVAQGWNERLVLDVNGPHSVAAAFAPTPSFPDVPAGNPAQEAIHQLAARGIIKGYGDGRFGPGDSTLRAQMAALIARAMGWDQENWGNTFTDGGGIDANLWRNVGTLAHYNVAKGYGNGTFGPNDTVTRAQVISFITRAMIVKGYWQLQPDNPTYFPDVPATSGHRQDLVTYHAYACDLPEHNANEPFPTRNDPSTRGWFAQVLWQALDRQFSGVVLP